MNVRILQLDEGLSNTHMLIIQPSIACKGILIGLIQIYIVDSEPFWNILVFRCVIITDGTVFVYFVEILAYESVVANHKSAFLYLCCAK